MADENTPLFESSAGAQRPKRPSSWSIRRWVLTFVACFCTVIFPIQHFSSSMPEKIVTELSSPSFKTKFPEHTCKNVLSKSDDYGHIDFHPNNDAFAPKQSYFYWFAQSESSPDNDPLILWLTGGPGCSSSIAFLTENGPCTLQDDGSMKENPFGWNSRANVLWVDQPAGVGFSFSEGNQSNIVSSIGENVYDFLQEWMSQHPSFNKNDVYIFGESFAGHFAPAVATAIIRANMKHKNKVFINLAGIGIGNALIHPTTQYESILEMAKSNAFGISLVSTEKEEQDFHQSFESCRGKIETCQSEDRLCEEATVDCNVNLLLPILVNHEKNPFDIRKGCPNDDIGSCLDENSKYSQLSEFIRSLNLNEKNKMTTSPNIVPAWEPCSNKVYNQLKSDWMKSYQHHFPALLSSGVKVLLYAGNADLTLNWKGIHKWTKNLQWERQQLYNAESLEPFTLENGRMFGEIQSAGGLTFVNIHDAGQLVVKDQPEGTLLMVNNFIHGEHTTPVL